MTRRQVLKAGLIGGAGLMLPLRFMPPKAFAARAIRGLSDPAFQPKFEELVPDALSPGFIYQPVNGVNQYKVGVGFNPDHETGLIKQGTGARVTTPIFGYGDVTDEVYTWPGRTFEVRSNKSTIVQWNNNLFDEPFLITSLDGRSVVDTSLHWAYSLHGYEDLTIDDDGVPIVVHLHGGHSKAKFDGNPEQFYTPGWEILGPRFGGRKFVYKNDQPAGNLWYHDHALGITRLNVYCGMAGFYFIRDKYDTGKPNNPLGLPAQPYEKAYAIQDRMFKENGELFYPAFGPSTVSPVVSDFNDPAWDDFIVEEDAMPEPPGGPSALAEFFGDHMVVNGKIWPKEEVRPRQYRMHFLNGTDSRFMALRFRIVPADATDFTTSFGTVPFYVIGSDQGLAEEQTTISGRGYLLSEPGSRYDIVIDFSRLMGQRIILENVFGDEPFGGEPGERIFECTDRIMAFDVGDDVGTGNPRPFRGLKRGKFGPEVGKPKRRRKVALFEGKDEFGRLQPLLGTAEPATDQNGKPINWPDEQVYIDAGLEGRWKVPSPGTVPQPKTQR